MTSIGECTGMTAIWCPRCGNCLCPLDSDNGHPTLNDEACPLHSSRSAHDHEPMIPLGDLLQAARLGLVSIPRMTDDERAASTSSTMTVAAEVQCRRAERVLKVCALLLKKAHDESADRLAAARELGVDEMVAVEADVNRALDEAGREARAVLKECEGIHAAWLGMVKR